MCVFSLAPIGYNVRCSLYQYMSMYVYHVNNGDGDQHCARSFCLVYDIYMCLKLNESRIPHDLVFQTQYQYDIF